VGSVVDVVSREEFVALLAALDLYKTATGVRLTALEAAVKTMPQDVKDKLVAVLGWVTANV
jgi:BMFP domain-containing protein YqiC